MIVVVAHCGRSVGGKLCRMTQYQNNFQSFGSTETNLPLESFTLPFSLIRPLRLRGLRTIHIPGATMAAVQATKDALDPSNSSKNTLKIENVRRKFARQ